MQSENFHSGWGWCKTSENLKHVYVYENLWCSKKKWKIIPQHMSDPIRWFPYNRGFELAAEQYDNLPAW